MGYSAKILLDSISEAGSRLTTFEITFPRIVLAEFNTHRMFSRNSASSRAIPVEKMIKRVIDDPFVPTYWGKNQPGMQAAEELDDMAAETARETWLSARDSAVRHVRSLIGPGTEVHKQIANRLLEPFMYHTCIVTATEWENFFALRCHPDAQPEIRKIAVMVRDLYLDNFPTKLYSGEWHRPLIQPYEELHYGTAELNFVSSGRCARVSYLTHDGKRDPEADITLARRLATSGHMSPLEHVAVSMGDTVMYGNFKGWGQFRKSFPNEDNFGAING